MAIHLNAGALQGKFPEPSAFFSMRANDHGLDRAVSVYVAAWNTGDATARQRYLDESWNEFGHFQDPLVSLRGRAAMGAYIATCKSGQPGVRWAVSGYVNHHHRQFHFSWQVLDALGRAMLAGHSFGELDVDARIRRLVGYFERAPDGDAGAPRAGQADRSIVDIGTVRLFRRRAND